jgi:hypothetical protein
MRGCVGVSKVRSSEGHLMLTLIRLARQPAQCHAPRRGHSLDS